MSKNKKVDENSMHFQEKIIEKKKTFTAAKKPHQKM